MGYARTLNTNKRTSFSLLLYSVRCLSGYMGHRGNGGVLALTQCGVRMYIGYYVGASLVGKCMAGNYRFLTNHVLVLNGQSTGLLQYYRFSHEVAKVSSFIYF